jgi:DNA polymerase-3 subunit epsilon/ATP-dependent DNA helicase DinG
MWVTHSFTLLNPWDYLKENLWDKLTSCVLTSATLSTSWNFLYIKGVLALDDFEFYSFESDFDYKKQASLFILTDTWSIKNNLEEITEFLRDFFLAVWGNILVLLTSFMVIKKIYTKSNIPLKKAWINLYAQSIWGSKIKQITLFKEDPNNSILLWTDSFWEGIDIPWEDLKYLIIHKFPFAVPSDPIFQARSIFFKDSFKEYSIPKAIIKLKQGFWRLIRTKTDKGVVILLDDRINSDWGAGFYEAFPKDINIKKWTKKQIIEVLSRG